MLYIILYLFIEVMISSYFASIFGGLLTFIFIILSALIGITLLRTFKYSLSLNIKDLTSGKISQEEFVKTNMAKALGAILLIVPGYFTDIVGILLQFGILTILLTKVFKIKPSNTNQYNYSNTYQDIYTQNNVNNSTYTELKKDDDDDIIDVEVIDTKPNKS
jgi:UPF0716 family protein affecting phage T7 exclusion